MRLCTSQESKENGFMDGTKPKDIVDSDADDAGCRYRHDVCKKFSTIAAEAGNEDVDRQDGKGSDT